MASGSINMKDLYQIAGKFTLKGSVKKIFPFGSGHINDTYKVETDRGDYLLQRINHLVFRDVGGLTRNLVSITDYLRERVGGHEAAMQVLNCIPAGDRGFVIQWDDGSYWRVFDFVQDCHSYDRVTGVEVALQGGRSFGWFVRELSDFPVEELTETIPGFHNAEKRIGDFEKAVESDAAGRAVAIQPLISLLLARTQTMRRIHLLGQEGKIPVRVTHNDTKINNVLFNKSNQGICVIDLDTVMPGYVHFDFGDAIRTFTNTAGEDEKESEKIGFNLDYYEAFANGFLEMTRDILTPAELDTLAFSPLYITYEQSIRFLTDYLNGDTYYKIRYPEHNLIRAKAQLRLLVQMESKEKEMQQVISRIQGN